MAETPDPVDIHVGQKIRGRRIELGMSQQALAAALKISFQQVQKYERGVNRVSPSRLWHVGKTLEVPITYFFEGLPGDAAHQPLEPTQEGLIAEQLSSKESLDLLRAYSAISEKKVRQKFTKLVRAIAEAEQ